MSQKDRTGGLKAEWSYTQGFHMNMTVGTYHGLLERLDIRLSMIRISNHRLVSSRTTPCGGEVSYQQRL